MRQADDFSPEHFDWLVEGRSQNQRSTLSLYKIIEAHEPTISRNVVFHTLAQELTAVAFSLWRAVFLTDLTGDFGDRLADLKRFLQTLIAHNAILHQTDFTTREWTFKFYLDNAKLRLRALTEFSAFLPMERPPSPAIFAKDDWQGTQDALDFAIVQFSHLVSNDAAR